MHVRSASDEKTLIQESPVIDLQRLIVSKVEFNYVNPRVFLREEMTCIFSGFIQ